MPENAKTTIETINQADLNHQDKQRISRLLQLGKQYSQEKLGDAIDLHKALSCFEGAANLGSIEGILDVAHTYLQLFHVEGNKESFQNSITYYQNAQENGLSSASFEYSIGQIYLSGTYGIPQDKYAALQWFCAAADHDNQNADYQFQAATMTEKLATTRDDLNRANHYYQVAAQCGNPEALYKLGIMNEYSVSSDPSHKEKASELYVHASEKGSDQAMYRIGLSLWNKENEHDIKEGLQYFYKANRLGNTDAQYMLGISYELGKGVQANQEIALDFFSRASAKGHASAEYHYAKLLHMRHEKSVATIEKMYTDASSKGCVEASMALARMYEEKQMIDKAIQFYQIASEQGAVSANRCIGRLMMASKN